MTQVATLPALVLLPGLDGTGKLFSEFVKDLGSSVDSLIVSYPKDQPLGYNELEALAVDESAALGAIKLPTLVLRARRDHRLACLIRARTLGTVCRPTPVARRGQESLLATVFFVASRLS
jgi:hypothetical protein